MQPSAVVDASVLVSAFLFPHSVPGTLITEAVKGTYRFCLSPILIEETRRSLLNPRLCSAYGHDAGSVRAWCDDVVALAEMVTALADIGRVCRDEDDDHVIAAAAAAKAGFIVTGDKDLLVLEEHSGIRIVTARSFADRFFKAP